MISYKEHLFVSFIDSMTLNESFSSPEKVSFLDLLLEAAIKDEDIEKMIAEKRRASIYYQGDLKNKKGWYSVEAVKIVEKGEDKFLLAYDTPKSGGKPVLKYFIQDKIVNWNILGKKEAESAIAYDKKIFKFFADPKIPAEQKKKFKGKLSKVGVGKKIMKFVLGGSLIAAMIANMVANQYAEKNVHARAYKSFLQLRQSEFTEKDLKQDEKDAFKIMVEKALSNPKKYTKSDGSTSFYDVANDLNKETDQEDKLDFGKKKTFGLKDQKNVRSIFTKLSLTVGNGRISETEDGYTVKDIYDFNQYYENPENYKLSNFPKKSKEIIKYFGDSNYLKGFEEIGNYYEAMGYKGFKVNINLMKSVVSKAKAGKTSTKTNLSQSTKPVKTSTKKNLDSTKIDNN